MELLKYTKILDAVVLLMQPLVEVVIHHIDDDTIVYINGSLSNRKVGDTSLLNKQALSDAENAVYSKINFDGRLLKSISVLLEDQWMLCINCDISVFSKLQVLSQALTDANGGDHAKFFENDWQEKLNISIHHYLQRSNLLFDQLDHVERKLLVKHLYDLGAFNEKKAPDYIAKTLNISRSTVFNYLKNWRKL